MDQRRLHQVALPAYRCLGHNHLTIRYFCEGERLPWCAPCHSHGEDDVDMTVFCFAERAHSEQFRERFGGEFLEPKDRPKGPAAQR
jgi:hypothetical protein